MGKWVTIKTFQNRIEAGMAKGILDESGIPSVIRADDAGGMRPNLAVTGGARLQVVGERADRALDHLFS